MLRQTKWPPCKLQGDHFCIHSLQSAVAASVPAMPIGLHFYERTHPRMNAALEAMIPLGKIFQLKSTARKYLGRVDRSTGKQALGSRSQAHVQGRYAAAAELRDFGERVKPAAIIGHAYI